MYGSTTKGDVVKRSNCILVYGNTTKGDVVKRSDCILVYGGTSKGDCTTIMYVLVHAVERTPCSVFLSCSCSIALSALTFLKNVTNAHPACVKKKERSAVKHIHIKCKYSHTWKLCTYAQTYVRTYTVEHLYYKLLYRKFLK